MGPWHIENAGPENIIIHFGDTIDEALVPLIRAATQRLKQAFAQSGEIIALVPSYTTIMVYYDVRSQDYAGMCDKIAMALQDLQHQPTAPGRIVHIPVWYHPRVGLDLERVAAHHSLTVDQLIHRHHQREYLVFAIGFAPGFAYLGSVSESIATPRLATPRKRVPAGSVAIADRQTAVYSTASPGGWNILGRTSLKMFDVNSDGLCPVTVGDRVRFVPVSEQQFMAEGGIADD